MLVSVSSSILTPNTRSLTLMILHLKPKVVNFWQKLDLLKTIFSKKCSIFSLIFPHASRTSSLTFSANVSIIDSSKTLLKLIKFLKNRFYSFSCNFPMRYVNDCPERKVFSQKYPHLQLLIQISKCYMGSWYKWLKGKHLFFWHNFF